MSDTAANDPPDAPYGETGPDANPGGDAAGSRLRSYIERIERLEEEKANLASDVGEVYSEAKSVGFDVKIMRRIVALRKKDPQTRAEEEALLATYMDELGMV